MIVTNIHDNPNNVPKKINPSTNIQQFVRNKFLRFRNFYHSITIIFSLKIRKKKGRIEHRIIRYRKWHQTAGSSF